MRGHEIYKILKGIGATNLYHANSVTTSCTFIEQGGLLSRDFVERNGLVQTAQDSDDIDKKYEIWDCIFLDHVDIHERGGKRKGPNQYGPVLFVFNLDILLHLPDRTEVCVTKINPINWDGLGPSERWLQNPKEVASKLNYGDFDKMLVIRTPTGKLPFPDMQAVICLDDPQRSLDSGENAYTHAKSRLKEAAIPGGICPVVKKRICQNGCACTQKYAQYLPKLPDVSRCLPTDINDFFE